ncbi:hypothetical protein ACS0TY_024619 [Phlomoides rotata]
MDRWQWKSTTNGRYSTSSAYNIILTTGASRRNQEEQGVEFKFVWNKVAPLKVSAMAWRLLQDRLPTRGNLARRGILLTEDEKKCTFCNRSKETADHLFLQCSKVDIVWRNCYKWIGCPLVQQNHLKSHFMVHAGIICGKMGREVNLDIILDEVKRRVWS